MRCAYLNLLSVFPFRMDEWYDIPREIPTRINPDITDPIKHSTVHYLDTKHPITHTGGTWLFPIPPHERTFWTHVKYVCHGIETPLDIGIVAQTHEGEWVDLLPLEPRPAGLWLDTKWAIPAVPLHEDGGQLYFQVRPIPHNQHMKYLKVKLLGFTELYQDTSFLLFQTAGQPRLLVVRDEGEYDIQYRFHHPIQEVLDKMEEECRFMQPIARIQEYLEYYESLHKRK